MKKEYSLKFSEASPYGQISDGNKNVSDVFFFALGNGIGAHYEYAPFGAITRTASATHIGNVDIVADNPFRFSSEFYDSELDLVYYNYRHYSPAIGRFLSRDTIEEQGGLNLYAFCGNAALSSYDRLGKVSCNCPPKKDNSRYGACLLNCLEKSNTQWALELLGLSFPATSVPLKPRAPFGSTPTWTTLLSYFEFKAGVKIGLRQIGRSLNPIANVVTVFAVSFLAGALLGCLGICAVDDTTY